MRMAGIVIALILVLLAPRPARAQEGLGIGLIVGEPSGISMKTWLHPSTAFDLAIAWSFESEDAVHLHGDYLIHNYNTFSVSRGALPFYYGLGARLKLRNDNGVVGVRAPVGVSYLFQHKPLDLFLEVVPILDIAPTTDLVLNASLGMRYYMN